MLKNGTARRSERAWLSPLHLAPKKDNGWRPCGEWPPVQSQNATQFDTFKILHIITGCHVFSTIDLVKAYNQIHVNESDISKTAITTPFGLYEFPFMTFGLRNVGQTFKRFVDEITQGLDFCYACLDDFLVFSHDERTHENHLRQLFTKLQEYCMVINTCVHLRSISNKSNQSKVNQKSKGIKPLNEKV